MKNNLRIFVALLLIIVTSAGCLKDKYDETDSTGTDESVDYSGFDFSMITSVSLAVEILNSGDEPISGVKLDIYTVYPLLDNGIVDTTLVGNIIFKGITQEDGSLTTSFNITNSTDSLFILCSHIGVPSLTSVGIDNADMSVTIGGSSGTTVESAREQGAELKASIPSEVNMVNGYYVLGDWTTSGVPLYLESNNDVVSNAFMGRINASLPENISLKESHPEYLNSSTDANINIYEDCEVWVTFVHEGANWRNVLGYYTYDRNNKPNSLNELTDKTIIFPNVSFNGSGGGLSSGNKVQLFYLDPKTNTYTNIFPANKTIGWFLVAQGWSNGTVSSGYYTHYSDARFNVENSANLRKHNVSLYDDQEEVVVLGFEDIRRDASTDDDFNDAIFYTTVNPLSAINTDEYPSVDDVVDTDGDGVPDNIDDFPNDRTKAFSNYYPGKGNYGTLAFEDLWPYKGDYDFNDLVVDYNFNQNTNANNQIIGIDAEIVVKAIGASYHNAFGIELNIASSLISQVTGQRITKGYLNINTNGAEANQSLATIICFDDAYNNLAYPGTGIAVNTSASAPYVEPELQNISIVFTQPVSASVLGNPPYNPFIIVDRDRDIEIHLPYHKPTDLADKSLLGTGDDNSNVSFSKYYVSDSYLPWAFNIPDSFDYPYEKEDIRDAYLHFNDWASSLGNDYPDWYLNSSGYRNSSLIYNP